MMATLPILATFLSALVIASGLYVAIAQEPTVMVQIAQWLYLVFGWSAIIPVTIVLHRYWKPRAQGALGITSATLLAVWILSGAVLTLSVLGVLPRISWVSALHYWTAAMGIGCIAVHVGLSIRKSQDSQWPKKIAPPAIFGVILMVGATAGAGAFVDQLVIMEPPPEYQLTYDNKPFKPANVQVTTDEFVHPTRLAGSIRCRSCHQAIYEQWSESMHRYAATDSHVDAGIRWFQRDNGPAAGRFCAGCHNPIGLLAGQYDAASTPPDTGTPPHDEGISCLVCHATVDVSTDPLGNGSFVIKPPDMPLISNETVRNMTIRMNIEAHKKAMIRRPLFQSALFCASCHQQYIPESLDGPGPSEAINQYPEWLESHYAETGEDGATTCNDCHMPLVEADDPAAVDGKVHSHRFAGANFEHPMLAGQITQANEVLKMLRNSVKMQLDVAKRQPLKDKLTLTVKVTNIGAGHRFPSGTTDISETWLEVRVGAAHKPLLLSGMLDKEHYLDPDAHVWRTVYTDKSHVPVDLHNLAVVENTVLDRYIDPGQSDVAKYEIPLRGQRGGKLPIQVRLRMRKANQRWNDWLSNFRGTTVPVANILEENMVVDLAELQFSTPAPSTTKSPAIGAGAPQPGMVFVPGGKTIIGSDDGDADERPVHTVEVASFYIDRFPVTNSQYRRFLRATKRPGPVHRLEWAVDYNWTGHQYPPGTDDRPAVLVSREEAISYCQWIGKRLPKESEWERAARGPNGSKYPWGDSFEAGQCAAVAGMDIPERVGMCPNRASPYGVQEMVGGVFEWTSDVYLAYPRLTLHRNANEWITTFGDPSYVIRGVPAGQVGTATTAASRAGHADNMRARIGFRCAKGLGK